MISNIYSWPPTIGAAIYSYPYPSLGMNQSADLGIAQGSLALANPAMLGYECGQFIQKRDSISDFVRRKYRALAAEKGYYHAAKNLRKQGYPIEIAREILL